MYPISQDENYGEFQKFIDELFSDTELVSQLDVVLACEVYDLHKDIQELVGLLPPGMYTRSSLSLQLNASSSAQGLGLIHGVVS